MGRSAATAKAKSRAARATGAAGKKARPGVEASPPPRATSASGSGAFAPSLTDGPASPAGGTTKDAVTRLLRLKFSHVPRTRLETAVNAEGLSLEQAIAQEVRRTAMSGEYIKAKFWVQIEEEFNLQCGDWDALPEPEGDDDSDAYDMDLPDIMRLIFGENPAVRTRGFERLESHLDACDALPLRQVYGLLRESCEGAKLTRAQSLRFQWMLLRYVAKHKAGRPKKTPTAMALPLHRAAAAPLRATTGNGISAQPLGEQGPRFCPPPQVPGIPPPFPLPPLRARLPARSGHIVALAPAGARMLARNRLPTASPRLCLLVGLRLRPGPCASRIRVEGAVAL